MRDHRVAMSPLARWEARLWTGPAAHLLGGALDVVTVLGRHLLAHAVRAVGERLRRAAGRAVRPPRWARGRS